MRQAAIPDDLHAVLRDIVEGKNVKRSRHELRWMDLDVTPAFTRVLQECGFSKTTVEAVYVEPGERVPAFCIENDVAYFGWVFWEKFSPRRLRKLFGSVVRNAKGDWDVTIPEKQRTTIYANPSLKSEMDIDNPSGY